MPKSSDWKENIRQKAKELIQSVKDVVKHHDEAEQILNDAADDLDLAYRNVLISSISGYIGMAGGRALAVASSSKLCKTLIDKHKKFDCYLKLKGAEFGISEKEILTKVFGNSDTADELSVKLNNVSNTVQE